VISKTTPQFWQRCASLPPDVRRLADKTYALWIDDPSHGSLHFKKNWLVMKAYGQCGSVANIGRWHNAGTTS
jgi:hypothetical protein